MSEMSAAVIIKPVITGCVFISSNPRSQKNNCVSGGQKNIFLMPLLKLISTRPSGENLVHLTFSAPSEVQDSFVSPGQFLKLSEGELESYFALASAPHKEEVDLLVKKGEGLAGVVCALEPGDEIETSLALGDGFALEGAATHDTHLISMGSGIAPFRSLILSRIEGRIDIPALTLWQASFTREHLPFADEYARWEKSGVKVIVCLDQEEGPEKGQIPDRLKTRGISLADSLVFWVGSKDFGAGIKATAMELGLPEKRFSSNF